MRDWRELVRKIEVDKPSVSVALVGKYVELHDAYLSVKEALQHAGLYIGVDIDIDWVSAEDLEVHDAQSLLGNAQGIIVPGGFGPRGVEGMIKAARYSREHGIPYFGLCLGMQTMVIEYARNVMGFENANSTEFDSESPFPIIDIMEDQENVSTKGGTMRLGNYPCELVPGTAAQKYYESNSVNERHRHRFEFNNDYREKFEKAGLQPSGYYPLLNLVEICEVKDHPFMLGTQFHPEFRSKPVQPHPLFTGFVGAANKIVHSKNRGQA